MADYAALKKKQRNLIRKGLEGSVLIAPSTAPTLTASTLFGVDGSFANATGSPVLQYGDLGHTNTDGAQYQTDINTSRVQSWGATSPTRVDITERTTTLQVMCQETNRATLALYTGYNSADLQPDSHGLLTIKEPVRPQTIYSRVLSVAVDTSDHGDIYLCRFMPLANLSNVSGQNQNNSDDGIGWGVTVTGELDDTYGTAHAYLFGGPGWIYLLAQMGFSAVTP